MLSRKEEERVKTIKIAGIDNYYLSTLWGATPIALIGFSLEFNILILYLIIAEKVKCCGFCVYYE